jgi:hypothetical protein
MLEKLGNGELPELIVAPVLVRGLVTAAFDDLSEVQDNVDAHLPASTFGLSVSVGADLNWFGQRVMERARSK